MTSGKHYVVTVLAALALGGCSDVSDVLFPPETPADTAAPAPQPAPAPAPAPMAQPMAAAPAPAAVTTTAAAAPAPAAAGGGTIVGQKAGQIAADLDRL